jgi:hypothetical protein
MYAKIQEEEIARVFPVLILASILLAALLSRDLHLEATHAPFIKKQDVQAVPAKFTQVATIFLGQQNLSDVHAFENLFQFL